ncbi:hypothetical protein [Marinobacter piscensis]|uniref:hypothetical protein n=1 Tax=Marinobacter piscensis TaxID=1562308 RepID=UPI0016429EDF|nr:hypothetical protein [Marinobacter piscensis]
MPFTSAEGTAGKAPPGMSPAKDGRSQAHTDVFIAFAEEGTAGKAPPGMSPAKDGRSQAHTDVFIAFPGGAFPAVPDSMA